MEAAKVPENGKSLTLSNGVELTYCEFGEEHDEVIISGAFYFVSFTPILKKLADNYHVYGVVMRMDGPITEKTAGGETDWSSQWCEDIYQFAKEMHLPAFTYLGKCHGSMPGWKLLQKHPEVLHSFIPISMIPGSHLIDSPNLKSMLMLQMKPGRLIDFIRATVRKEESIQIKLQEMKTLGKSGLIRSPYMGSFMECKSYDEVLDFMKDVHTPMLMIYGTEDPGYKDWKAQIMELAAIVPDMKLVTYQGERHLFELDIPDKIAGEVLFYLDQLRAE